MSALLRTGERALYVTRHGAEGTGGSAAHAWFARFYAARLGPAMEVFAVPIPVGVPWLRKVRTMSNLRKGLMSGVTEETIARFHQRLAEIRPRIVVLDSSLFGPLAKVAKAQGCAVVTQLQNCEYDYYAGEAALCGGMSALRLQAAFSCERTAIESSDRVLALCENDRARLELLYDCAKPIEVVNPLLESLRDRLNERQHVRHARTLGNKTRHAVFLGSAWHHNRHACARLIERWTGRHRLSIVGSVCDWVRKQFDSDELERRQVHVTGFLDSLASVLDDADAMVCPMTLGSGIKIKMVDALAHACPVLASREAMHGFEFARAGGHVQLLDGALAEDALDRLPSGGLDVGLLLADVRVEADVQDRRCRDALTSALSDVQ
jgi:glycosyltransferase involved in cell wall biosynthesis